MRFHFGVSFNFRTLKKFFYPFLLGLLSYFCFNYLNIASVNAMTNLDTNYNLELNQIDFTDKYIYSDYTMQQFFDKIINSYSEDSIYDLLIDVGFSDNKYIVYVYLFPKMSNIPYTIYGYQTYLRSHLSFTSSTKSIKLYYFGMNESTLSSDDIIFNNLFSCLSDNSSCVSSFIRGVNSNNATPLTEGYDIQITKNTANFVNENSYNLILNDYGFPYYSNKNLVYNDSYYESSVSRFQKTLIINNNTYNNNDTIPTYLDLFHSEPSEPSEPNPPIDNLDFSNYIFWFREHKSIEDILINIYTLLFIFTFSILFLKVLNIIKGVK